MPLVRSGFERCTCRACAAAGAGDRELGLGVSASASPTMVRGAALVFFYVANCNRIDQMITVFAY